jgi:protein-S-isoprenylcysteine O-methyltransferase Ste14
MQAVKQFAIADCRLPIFVLSTFAAGINLQSAISISNPLEENPMTTETTFRLAFWILLGVLLLIRAYSAFRVRQAGERFLPDRAAIEREGRGMFAIRFVGFFILIALLVFYALNPPWIQALLIPFPPWLRWLGFFLGLTSLALMAWTQVELGTQWSAQLQLREEHHLVTTGPYARVRHPMYTAMFGWGIALALVTAHWIFVVLAVLAIAGLIARVPREEQMMIEEFGEEYKAYMQRTGRFFPK